MARVKHNTTRRGTQKQRKRSHDAYLQALHPWVYQAKIDSELRVYRQAKHESALKAAQGNNHG